MKILVADDHPLYLEAVRAQLERLFADIVIGGAASLDDVFALASGSGGPFDLFLIDFHMPGMSVDMLARLVRTYPDTPVAIISGTAEARDVQASIRAGARGFIPKTATGAYLSHAIELLLAGGTSVPTEILLAQDSRGETADSGGPAWLAGLTAREREVLKGVARGLSNKEIGRELNLAEVTIKLHLGAVFRKVGVRNRAEAAVQATQAGLHTRGE